MTLAPWCAAERWSFFQRDGKTIAKVEGRERCPTDLKSDWVWRFRNDYEQTVEEAPWFHPELPIEQRRSLWLLRNPFQNGGLFVWGVADRNYEYEVTEGRYDMPMLVQRNDIGEQGYQRGILRLDDGATKTWTSYSSPKLDWSLGCQPTGIWEIKFVPRFW